MSEQPTVAWEGKYLRAMKAGEWEFAARVRSIQAVVILAEHDGKVILVEQERVPLGGRRCLELPAGLVGDEDDKGVEETAVKELEEETGFTASHVERLGEFHSSPGMVAEGFTLVRAHGVREGGEKSDEPIAVHLVEREKIADFVADKRKEGIAVDSKLLLLLGGSLL